MVIEDSKTPKRDFLCEIHLNNQDLNINTGPGTFP